MQHAMSFPLNMNSPQRAYVVTCPTLGTLALPVILQSNGVISPPILRP